MVKNSPTLEEWRILYESMIRVKEIAPWEWMLETDIFGVQDPETDEVGFVSVMGMAGEHYAIAVYRGIEGLHGFWGLRHQEPIASPEQVLEIPQLQASLEDRRFLEQEDREIIKKLGLRFRGRNAWPLFRAFQPGYVPWFLEAPEARLMRCALEQTLDIALRFKEDDELLEPSDDESYLIRVPRKKDGGVVWEDSMTRVPAPGPARLSFIIPIEELEKLKKVPLGKHLVEIDFFLFPAAVEEHGSRPRFPYLLLVVDAENGMILGNQPLMAEPSLEAMWASIPERVLHLFSKVGLVPKEVRVRSELLEQLLHPLAVELSFTLKPSRTLPNIDYVKEYFLQQLG